MAEPRGAPDRAAPMAAAPFVWRQDGRPDWRAMWTSFCELALFGGPPHRGLDQALRGPQGGDGASDPAMVEEIRRGILETTGLASEALSSGWIAVACESPAMARWLGGAIALENVDLRVEGDRVLLPAGPRFRLENEVKSIITVVAKTHHYWAMHGSGARGDRAGPLKIGVGGPGHGKTALIDALRQRYGRRRAVVASLARVAEVNDHAIDLVLVEVGEDPEAPGFGLQMVDAIVGVLDASAVNPALGRGDRSLELWHLLVVATGGAARIDLTRLEQDTSARRRGHPTAFVDLATTAGVDVVASWLERELRLPPRRGRG